jgi:hypothetical protein
MRMYKKRPLTDVELAEALGIKKPTFYVWKAKLRKLDIPLTSVGIKEVTGSWKHQKRYELMDDPKDVAEEIRRRLGIYPRFVRPRTSRKTGRVTRGDSTKITMGDLLIDSEYVSLHRAAQILGISYQTLRRWSRKPSILDRFPELVPASKDESTKRPTYFYRRNAIERLAKRFDEIRQRKLALYQASDGSGEEVSVPAEELQEQADKNPSGAA